MTFRRRPVPPPARERTLFQPPFAPEQSRAIAADRYAARPYLALAELELLAWLGRGAPPEEIKAKKIFYWRHNNTFKIDGGSSIKAN